MGRKRKHSEQLPCDVAIKEELIDEELEQVSKTKKKKKKHRHSVKSDEDSVDQEKLDHSEDLDDDRDDSIEWDNDELVTLISNVEKECPKNDSNRYCTTLEKLDWEKIKFNNHSAEECKENVLRIMKKVRRFRTLSEMIDDARNYARNPFKCSTTGRIKHPDMPKKPMTPFFRYFSEKRPRYQELYPTESMGQLSKMLSEKFASLSDKKRNKYRKRYDEEMAEYKEKYEQFRRDHPEVFRTQPRAKVEKQTGPAKARSPFQFFTESKLKKYSEEERKNAMDTIRQQWADLSDNKRIKYIRKAVEDQCRYETELSEYVKENPEFKPPKIRSKLTKSELDLKYKYEGRPQKPPSCGYILFSKLMLSEVKDVPAKEKMVIIAKRWREMSEEERAEYNQKAQKNQTKYIAKFDAYLEQLPEEEKEKVLAEKKLKLPSEKKLKSSNPMMEHTAFMAYQLNQIPDMGKEYPDKSKSQLMDMINTRWQSLEEAEKSKYMEMAKSLGKYMPKQRRKQKDEAEVELCEQTGLKRPARNGFSLFCSQNWNSSNSKPQDRMQLASEKWKQMSDSEKQEYSDLAKQRNQTFNNILNQYKENGTLPDSKTIEMLSHSESITNGDEPKSKPKATKIGKKKKSTEPIMNGLEETKSKSKTNSIESSPPNAATPSTSTDMSKFLYETSDSSDSSQYAST